MLSLRWEKNVSPRWEKIFLWDVKTIFKEKNTCDGVDDQKQVAGGESGTLKGGKLYLPWSTEMFCQLVSYPPGIIYFGWRPWYLAVCVMDLEGDRLPVQLHPLGVDQLGAVLILPNEPSTWESRGHSGWEKVQKTSWAWTSLWEIGLPVQTCPHLDLRQSPSWCGRKCNAEEDITIL